MLIYVNLISTAAEISTVYIHILIHFYKKCCPGHLQLLALMTKAECPGISTFVPTTDTFFRVYALEKDFWVGRYTHTNFT